MKKRIYKILASLIIFLLSFEPLLAAEAETVSPAPSPEPIIEVQVTNNETTVTNEIVTDANTGDNTITASPSPEPSPTAESTPSPTPNPSPNPSLIPSPSPETSPAAAVTTADAVSVTQAETKVNTTELNSLTIYKTLNIFADGNIDLTDPALMQNLVQESLAQNPDSATVNISYDGANIANVSNEIVSLAQSGNNSAAGGTALVNTGNSFSVVTLLNRVNTTIIDSQIYLVTINIFGNVSAHIILPELSSGGNTPTEQNITVANQASVNNQVNSQANTGQNTIVTETGKGTIDSGDAESTVNVANVVNTTLINATVSDLFINVLGRWEGRFLGADQWLNLPAYPASATTTNNIAVSNQATVTNDITSLADSGGNTLEADDGQIITGDAYSAVSLFNFVNTTIINSHGFWGFINIFGDWTGNVGTANALFPDSAEPEPPSEAFTDNPGSDEAARATGGLLEVSQGNNAGEYILPGDTVTFEVIVKNPGAGKVYDTKLWLGLEKDGLGVGGGWIPVGDIPSHHAVKITTGMALAETAEGGPYSAKAKAVGYVGPDDAEIAGEAESSFLVNAFTPIIYAAQPFTTPAQAQEEPDNILGSTIAAGITPFEKLFNIFIWLLLLLIIMKLIEKRIAYDRNR